MQIFYKELILRFKLFFFFASIKSDFWQNNAYLLLCTDNKFIMHILFNVTRLFDLFLQISFQTILGLQKPVNITTVTERFTWDNDPHLQLLNFVF